MVQDGAFQSSPSESPTTGKYWLRIMAWDPSQMPPDGQIDQEGVFPAQFPPYHMMFEIPSPDGRLNIEVLNQPARTGR